MLASFVGYQTFKTVHADAVCDFWIYSLFCVLISSPLSAFLVRRVLIISSRQCNFCRRY